MKRCPKCNRTYTHDTQKFCTLDGGVLESVVASQGDTIRINSSQLKKTINDATTKASSHEVSESSGEFDPFKTVMARPKGSTVRPEDPRDLAPEKVSPRAPAETSASLPPLPAELQNSEALPDSGTLPSLPSAPLPPPDEAESFLGDETIASYRSSPPAKFEPPPNVQQPEPRVVARPAKKSRLPLVLGILAVLFAFGLGALGAAYFFVLKPILEKRNEINETQPEPSVESGPKSEPTTDLVKENSVTKPPPYVPPAGALLFVNSKQKLDGKLAEHYVDFSFYYPGEWEKDPTAGVPGATNFAKVERRLPPDFTQENFAVGLYSSAGSAEADRTVFHTVAENLSAQFKKNFPEYRKVSEGSTTAGVYDGYEFRFEGMSRNTDKGDLKLWGRVIFVPPVDGSKNGVTLLMLATSLAPELKSVKDVGEKGQLPMMLESFRFGKYPF